MHELAPRLAEPAGRGTGPPQPLSLRVTYTDSSWVILNNPVLQGDTIVGRDHQNAQVRVPLDSVLLTNTRHGDAGKSVLAFLGVAAGLFAVAAGIAFIHCSQTACFDMQR